MTSQVEEWRKLVDEWARSCCSGLFGNPMKVLREACDRIEALEKEAEEMTIDIAADRAIIALATPGKWSSMYHNRTESWAITYDAPGADNVNDRSNLIARAIDGSSSHSDNFDFIAEARTSWPAALDEIEELRRQLEVERSSNISVRLRQELDDVVAERDALKAENEKLRKVAKRPKK